MGAIGCARPKGMSDVDFFEQEYPAYDVLATARKNGVVYAAFKGSNGNVFAFVSPFHYGSGPTEPGETWFVYKTMDESVGPYYYDCPAKILDLLTEPRNEYAAEWRAECRRRLAA